MANSITAEERIKAVQQKLDEYEGRCGLPPAMAPGTDIELNGYLTMDKISILSLSVEDCAAIAYRLAQFSFYITRLYNTERSNQLWAEAILRELLADVKDNYGQYTKHELKFALLAKENAFAQKVHDMVKHANHRIQRLTGLSEGINFLSKVLMDVRRSKYTKETSYG